MYKCLYHRLQDVMLSVCLLSSTRTLLKCKLMAPSELMHLNSGMPEVLQDLHSLLCDLICEPALQAYVERMFSVCGLLYSGDEVLCSGLSI